MTTLVWIAIAIGGVVVFNIALVAVLFLKTRREERRAMRLASAWHRDFPIWPPSDGEPDWDWPKDRAA